MSLLNDGGPAFPRPASEYTAHGSLPDGNDAERAQDGMTLRDYFAAKALPAVIDEFTHDAPLEQLETEIAAECYRLADAMIEERAK